MKTFSLKSGMLIGTASAATQIEGGALSHSWMDWYQKGHIQDKTSPARANDHYNLWREDAGLMKELKLQIYRFGVEWARIEPEEGVFDEEAVAHYVREAELLKSLGIEPLVTLHHFTNPMWFENKGAFKRKENVPYFIRFVEKMVTAFGPLVHEYITINEPNVYATNGYFFGSWPPGEKSVFKAVHVMSVLAAAHAEAYGKIHDLQKAMGITDTKVSFANHVRVFVPENPKKLSDRFFTKWVERIFQGSISCAMCTGEFPFPIRNIGHIKKGKYCDFIAVNYYARSTVAGLKDGVRHGVPVNDLGWEIYPEGIVECTRKLYEISPLPIYITENGTCDNEDAFRCLYLYEHLKKLCESELPIQRYYHWCFCDNFEWAEGESARFGIVHVDYETQKRTVKKSGRFLRDVIVAHGVDETIYETYVKEEHYHTNA